MSSSPTRRSLRSIENTIFVKNVDEIEMHDLSEPLFTEARRASFEDENEANLNETMPFPVDLNLNDTDSENRSQTSNTRETNRSNRRFSRTIQQRARDMIRDLLPPDDRTAWVLPIGIASTVLVLMVISIFSVIVGFSTVEYDQFAVTLNQLTGVLDLKNPYSAGFYILPLWKKFVKFDKVARYLNFEDLDVFTTDQASVIMDVSIVYRIRPEQIEPIWLNFADKHESVLRLVAENILRNHGNKFSIFDYRARREHVEDHLAFILQQTLSGDCCPSCCNQKICSKTIEHTCSSLNHCQNLKSACSKGYFVDIDGVFILQVKLPSQIRKRLYQLMLTPLYTEIAESQENAAVVRIETERQRNQYLNEARLVLMTALAQAESAKDKARAETNKRVSIQTTNSEKRAFQRLAFNKTAERLSVSFLNQLGHFADLKQAIDVDSFVNSPFNAGKQTKNKDLFDSVAAEDVFDLSDFLRILEF